MLRAALAHRRSGRLKAAASLCQRVLQQSPDHADTLHLLGVLHAQAGRLQAALPHLVKAVRQAGFLNNLGNVFKGLGRLDKAIESYRQAAALDRDNADIHCNLGCALRGVGALEKAEASLRRATALDATVWHQVKHGYLGASMADGFATALALQIADELLSRLPGIFGRYRLDQLWAFKYDSRLQGIATHADVAAVNVNFWLTPDAANRDSSSGAWSFTRRGRPRTGRSAPTTPTAST